MPVGPSKKTREMRTHEHDSSACRQATNKTHQKHKNPALQQSTGREIVKTSKDGKVRARRGHEASRSNQRRSI